MVSGHFFHFRGGVFFVSCIKTINMKQITVFLVILMLLSGFYGCRTVTKQETDGVVSVSIMPVKYFIDYLTDASLEVNVMVPSGASHATYAPTTGQLRKLSDSDIYFRIGHLGYEQAFIDRLSELNPRMQVVNLSDGVELIHGEEVDHGDHVHEGGIDPHIWMSPAVMLKLLPRISEAITETYPDLTQAVKTRYAELHDAVETLHQELESLTEGLTQRSFMIFHPALTYMARDYGLEQIAIERHGKEPSPAQLRHMVRHARHHDIRIIFIQEEFDMRSAQLVSEETGAALVQINPLAYEWREEIKHIMETLNTSLQ